MERKPFIFCNDDFGQEIIAKVNALFDGTLAAIPTQRNGSEPAPKSELAPMRIFQRLAITTVCYRDAHLREMNLFPITPLQSEFLLKEGRLPLANSKAKISQHRYSEELALLLYDRNHNGINFPEAHALYEHLLANQDILQLSSGDLEKRLLLVHVGLERDTNLRFGVKPVVLPGLTQVYAPAALYFPQAHRPFSYGLDKGLPAHLPVASQPHQPHRMFYLPRQHEATGLQVLVRCGNDLVARHKDLDSYFSSSRITMAPHNSSP